MLNCVILMFYSSIREECLVAVVFSGDAPLASIFNCIFSRQDRGDLVSRSMGKVVQDQFLSTE